MTLIYISNTRIPSEKANTYQSFVMCEGFSHYVDKVSFVYPKRWNNPNMRNISDPYEYYDVKKSFGLERVFSLDMIFLLKVLPRIWFLIQNISFAISYIFRLKLEDTSSVVFSRDTVGLRFISLAKRFGFIKQKVFFEAHVYSKDIEESCKYIDGLIVINSYLKTLYEKAEIKNILVAHDGVKIETFKEVEIETAKSMLGFDTEKKYITYIGRFNTMGNEKGIPEIIKSLRYIADSNVTLLCVGGPLDTVENYYRSAEHYGVDSDMLIFIDRQPVSELYKYIGASSLLLMPFPHTEHYAYFMSPLKMFEYMASKRPIVATRLPSIKEVLEDGKNAILCKPDDAKDLAEKIEIALSMDCTDICKQAFEDVKQYTWKNRAKNIVQWIGKC